ncbi:MAG: DMT family transporter [Treponema sp.]|jgi:drug/metabolite transporter (DMT)-like permease|nr:DMT family transporter [Treponema sp.]
MNKRALRADALLLLTAAIWGFGFVAQRAGMQYIGPFAFNGIRFLLASLVLLPYALWRVKNVSAPESAISGKTGFKPFVVSAFLAGFCVFIAVSFQQLGIMFTTVGNAGFITGLYVVLTPVFGIFLKRKTGRATWVGAFLTLTGLYFLSVAGGPGGVNPGDVLVGISAVFWAFHVLLIDRLVKSIDAIALSVGQFFFTGISALVAALLVEPAFSAWLQALDPQVLYTQLYTWISLPELIRGLSSGSIPFELVSNALVPILYAGLVSGVVGYTLQIVAQRDAPPAHASIILCLEGSFAALGGVLLLGETVSAWTLTGFALMLAGMLATQWEVIMGKS